MQLICPLPLPTNLLSACSDVDVTFFWPASTPMIKRCADPSHDLFEKKHNILYHIIQIRIHPHAHNSLLFYFLLFDFPLPALNFSSFCLPFRHYYCDVNGKNYATVDIIEKLSTEYRPIS